MNTRIFSSRFTFLSLSVLFSLSFSLWYFTISCRHHVIPNTMTTPGEFDLENITIQMHAQLLSRVQLFVSLWTIACQAPLSKGFSRQEYWSELPFPPQGDFPNPGIKPMSPVSPALADRCFTTELPGNIKCSRQNLGHDLCPQCHDYK